jgi:hypothetical protein
MNSTVVGRKDTLLVEPNRARSVALGAPNEVNAQLAGMCTARHRRTGTSDNGWYALRRHELLDNMLKRLWSAVSPAVCFHPISYTCSGKEDDSISRLEKQHHQNLSTAGTED